MCGQEIYREKPVVLLSRDPRDTVVSCYFQKSLRLMMGMPAPWPISCAIPCTALKKISATIWRGSRAAWSFGISSVTYEEIITDPVAVMRGIVDFVGVDRDDTEIERVVANNTFERMRRARPAANISIASVTSSARAIPATRNPTRSGVARSAAMSITCRPKNRLLRRDSRTLRYFVRCRELTLEHSARGVNNARVYGLVGQVR